MLKRPLAQLADEGLIDQGWADALSPLASLIGELGERLEAEQDRGVGYLPAERHILRAFQRPLADVRVLIVGQDPYPTPGHPIGLSFAVEPGVRPVPRSLVNIYRERESDLGIPPAVHGDLATWADQGVLLLNRVLTVTPGVPASHRGWGWEKVTELAIRTLVARDAPLVSILWGKDAANLQPMLAGTAIVSSAHPSPLSARRGFFGSRPFSRTNELLSRQGAAPIDWRTGDENTNQMLPPALF